MKTHLKWRRLIVMAAAVFFGLLRCATAQLTCVTNGGAITITGYSGSGLSLIIPGATNGYPVTTIGSAAFYNNMTLTTVTIPNSVTNIGDLAFANSALVSVTIPGSVIGIGNQAFANCQSLTNISVNATNPAYSSLNGVLFDKAQDTLIQYPAALSSVSGCYTVPAGVSTIGGYAFFGASGFATVTMPASVINIGDDCFAYCLAQYNGNLTVYFAGNAPSVGVDAFYADGLNGQVVVYYLPGTAGWTGFSTSLGSDLASANFWFLPAPEVLVNNGSFGVQSNLFGFIISWATNASVVVEACSNLADPVWLPVSTNTVTADIGTANFTDPNWMKFRARDYRLVSQ
ncbi:MAG TPA: leucine-rich repeat domain-containing protein [Candidatus Sulfotelmatobacter sp.]|nr:leucine-rich repeat domain-containing protein [Candidatus Sulfotelmatobacter sp.]